MARDMDEWEDEPLMPADRDQGDERRRSTADVAVHVSVNPLTATHRLIVYEDHNVGVNRVQIPLSMRTNWLRIQREYEEMQEQVGRVVEAQRHG